MQAFCQEHLNALYDILRYLKTILVKGLFSRKNWDRKVEGYTDADWADFIKDRRFTFGYCSFVWENLVT